MKILFVLENYHPFVGGAEVVFKNLAEGFVKEGHEVNIINNQIKKTNKFEIINGVKVHRVNSFGSRYLFTFLAIPKVLKLAKNSDVIQTTTFTGAPPAWFGGKIRKKPVLLTVHEVWVDKWKKVTDFNFLKSFVHNILEKMIYTLKFDRYICVSNSTRKDLANINITNAVTIHNGLDYGLWNPKNFDDSKIKTNPELKEKFLCFSWGRPGVSKGFEYLIRSIPLILKKIPNAFFLLMTNKDYNKKKFKQLTDLVKKLGIGKHISIIKPVPYKELGNFIKAAACVVIPSIAEGFGYTTVETCAIGTPVVATNAGSIPEVISNKYVLVEARSPNGIASGVITVKNKDYKTSALKKFYWKTAIDKYLDEYKKLVR